MRAPTTNESHSTLLRSTGVPRTERLTGGQRVVAEHVEKVEVEPAGSRVGSAFQDSTSKVGGSLTQRLEPTQ